MTEQLDAEVEAIVAVRPDLTLVALADGAEENWRYFEGEKWEEAIKIVDHGHASQQLKAALTTYYRDTIDGRAEYERLRLILRDKMGGVDEVIGELNRLDRKLYERKHPRRRKLRKERKYFKNQRERMDYAYYQALRLPIGSGVVEAACKTLATQRLKQSGMNWGDGKQPILTIRSLQQSDRWDNGWDLIAGAFRKEICPRFQASPSPMRSADPDGGMNTSRPIQLHTVRMRRPPISYGLCAPLRSLCADSRNIRAQPFDNRCMANRTIHAGDLVRRAEDLRRQLTEIESQIAAAGSGPGAAPDSPPLWNGLSLQERRRRACAEVDAGQCGGWTDAWSDIATVKRAYARYGLDQHGNVRDPYADREF